MFKLNVVVIVMDKHIYKMLKRYFNILHNVGYLNYENVFSMIVYIFCDRLLNKELSFYLTADDYKLITTTLLKLSNCHCILPDGHLDFAAFSNFRSNPENLRLTTEDDIRFAENNNIRLLN